MTVWAIAVLVVFVLVGVLLRLRYGNLFSRLLRFIEGRSGLTPRTAILIAGGATLLLWFAIALTAGPQDRGGLEDLFGSFGPSEPAPGPR